MKFVFKIIFLFLLSKISIGQTNHLRLIEKGKYAKAEKKILKSIQKDSNDVKLNYTLSVLLIQKKYKGYDTRRAYLYMLKAKKIYSNYLLCLKIRHYLYPLLEKHLWQISHPQHQDS